VRGIGFRVGARTTTGTGRPNSLITLKFLTTLKFLIAATDRW